MTVLQLSGRRLPVESYHDPTSRRHATGVPAVLTTGVMWRPDIARSLPGVSCPCPRLRSKVALVDRRRPSEPSAVVSMERPDSFRPLTTRPSEPHGRETAESSSTVADKRASSDDDPRRDSSHDSECVRFRRRIATPRRPAWDVRRSCVVSSAHDRSSRDRVPPRRTDSVDRLLA